MNGQQIILSFIVPFYNVEKYIAQCLDSLLNQNIPYSDYEIICINDCSPDNTEMIVRQYMSQYPNIHLVKHENNKRQGAARNTGLQYAKGKYVWFIDSDDYICSNVLKQLVTIMDDKRLDILHFDYKRVLPNDNILPYRIYYIDERICTGKLFLVDEWHEIWWKRCVEAWRKIHLKDFLLQNNLFFEPNVMYEDTDWAIKSMMSAQRVMHTDMAPYCYRENIESVTQRPMTPQVLYYKKALWKRCAMLRKEIKDMTIRRYLVDFRKYLWTEIHLSFKQLPLVEKFQYIKMCVKNKTL